MTLPPEQINIKRRREEEPVETLYIQSDIHQKKRRFTDFIFQRVRVGGDDGSPSPPPAASASASLSLAQTRRALRAPRSVSSLNFTPPSNADSGVSVRSASASRGTDVPVVRATSPGAEIREEKRLAALRKEKYEGLKKALYSSQSPPPPPSSTPPSTAGRGSGSAPSSPGSGGAAPVRKFHISRSSMPLSLLKATNGGVQKRKPGDGTPAVAILVEKLRRKPHSREASMVADFAMQNATVSQGVSVALSEREEKTQPVRPRKRPVVNQAEKRWREERKANVSAAKKHIAETLEKEAHRTYHSNWEDESDDLARQFEEIALELDGGMDKEPTDTREVPSPAIHTGRLSLPKPPLKYQPRSSNRPRTVAEHTRENMQVDSNLPEDQEEDDDDADYVYDTYIRRPIPENMQLTNPLTSAESDWQNSIGVDPAHRRNVGVIVIAPEDEEYWENFIEEDEDEDEWDSEDADSNAENNPANDYPDEELSSEDEYDDPTAIYSRYRDHAASDDEEYDIAGSYDDPYSIGHGGLRFRSRRLVGEDSEDDDDDSCRWW